MVCLQPAELVCPQCYVAVNYLDLLLCLVCCLSPLSYIPILRDRVAHARDLYCKIEALSGFYKPELKTCLQFHGQVGGTHVVWRVGWTGVHAADLVTVGHQGIFVLADRPRS